ncbi:WxL domain-containing protein [Vagococcus sp. BWB3-3]|uniref:WxL domain-containing protein n=1 Tax=Vagococcus allomyrinae TaxID=2794353 RepID=A0A940SUK9_9ENTE|nr:WxL domain-containing protein [Vagococcus allomyrinae]MBP1040166.1 WxL domain-containing protein [Vagococcus allomyrinae]
MKLQKLAGAVLLGSLALGMVAPQALAASEDLTGKGTVTFLEDKSITGPTDPEDPGKEVEVDPGEGTTQTEQGPLSVDFVSVLKFGEQTLTPSANAGVYEAQATTITKDGEKVERGNYVQVTDKRSGSTKQGWQLSAAMTKKFTSETTQDEIGGATISFANPFLNSDQADKGEIQTNATVLLESDGTSAPVANAAAGKGWGTYTVEYGTSTDANMDKSVILTVPASTPLSVDEEYTADITWTIANLD